MFLKEKVFLITSIISNGVWILYLNRVRRLTGVVTDVKVSNGTMCHVESEIRIAPW